MAEASSAVGLLSFPCRTNQGIGVALRRFVAVGLARGRPRERLRGGWLTQALALPHRALPDEGRAVSRDTDLAPAPRAPGSWLGDLPPSIQLTPHLSRCLFAVAAAGASRSLRLPVESRAGCRAHFADCVASRCPGCCERTCRGTRATASARPAANRRLGALGVGHSAAAPSADGSPRLLQAVARANWKFGPLPAYAQHLAEPFERRRILAQRTRPAGRAGQAYPRPVQRSGQSIPPALGVASAGMSLPVASPVPELGSLAHARKLARARARRSVRSRWARLFGRPGFVARARPARAAPSWARKPGLPTKATWKQHRDVSGSFGHGHGHGHAETAAFRDTP